MIGRGGAGRRDRPVDGWLQTSLEWLWSLLPGVLVVFLGFDAGGFFAGTTGLVAAVLAVLAACHLLATERVWLGIPGWVAVAGLGLYAIWSLVSGAWSSAPARGLLAFDRGVLYLAVVALGLMTRVRVSLLTRGLLAAVVVVCAAGFLSRALPHVFPVHAGLENQRLSYPVSYWNALGMVAALGVALSLHLAGDPRERLAIRMLAGAAVPLLGATLLLTFSRGSIAALVVMILVYLLASPARLRVIATGLALAGPTAAAVVSAYDADRLASPDPTTPAAVAQGHDLALVVVGCMLGAAVLILLIRLAEARLTAPRVSPRAAAVGLSAAIVVALAAAGALGGAGWVSHQYHRFAYESALPHGAATRNRLLSPSNNGRLEMWRVALHGFDGQPWRGQGAGTYQLLWERKRPAAVSVVNAHSLYLESLDELGIAGTLPLLAALAALLFALGRKLLGGRERSAAALALAVLVGWILHAGVDWDWQMPVVTLPVLALAAATAAGRPAPQTAPRRLAWLGRLAAALAGVGLAVGPALVAISQADLDSSVQAFHRHDCRAAIADARASSAVVSWRPEPYELIAYCQAQRQQPVPALEAGQQAISWDPRDWEFHYALAIVLARAGDDPRPQLQMASRLDPLEPMVQTALQVFDRASPSAWRQRARALGTDIP